MVLQQLDQKVYNIKEDNLNNNQINSKNNKINLFSKTNKKIYKEKYKFKMILQLNHIVHQYIVILTIVLILCKVKYQN